MLVPADLGSQREPAPGDLGVPGWDGSLLPRRGAEPRALVLASFPSSPSPGGMADPGAQGQKG